MLATLILAAVGIAWTITMTATATTHTMGHAASGYADITHCVCQS